MYQIDNPTAAPSRPASTAPGTAGYFTDGSVGGGVAPTILPAEWLNSVQGELMAILSAAGITPSKTIFNQIAQAIQSGKLNYAADTGVANAYAATYAPAVTALTDGLVLGFQAAHANTGASTFNVNGLGAQPIVGGAHAALQGGEIVVNGEIEVVWSASLSSWVLLGCTGGAVQVGNSVAANQAPTLGQVNGRMQTFTSSGNYTVPAGITTVYISGCAGGGGGGGAGGPISSNGTAGGGGGGGAGQSVYRKAFGVTPGQVIAVTIAAGGGAGVGNAPGNSGGAGGGGGNTSFGALLLLAQGAGGGGGVYNPSSPSGGNGGGGFPAGSAGTDGALGASGGAGASSPFGGGGGSMRGGYSSGAAGQPGAGYGSGGGGGSSAYQSTSASGQPGAAGTQGYLMVEW